MKKYIEPKIEVSKDKKASDIIQTSADPNLYQANVYAGQQSYNVFNE